MSRRLFQNAVNLNDDRIKFSEERPITQTSQDDNLSDEIDKGEVYFYIMKLSEDKDLSVLHQLDSL